MHPLILALLVLLSGCGAVMCNDTREGWPGVPQCEQ